MITAAKPTSSLATGLMLIIFFGLSAIVANAQVTQNWVAQHSGIRGVAVVTDANGNIYVTGPSLPDAAHNFREDIITIKYDQAGSEIWVSEFDGTDDASSVSDFSTSLTLDPAGNVIVTGRSVATGFITLKYDPNGNLLWKTSNTGGNGGYEAVRVATDGAGNVYITGNSTNVSSSDNFVTVKYDPNGNLVWARTYNGPNNFTDKPHGLAVTTAGDVAVTGESAGGATIFDIATVLYDTNGNERWVRRYNDPAVNGQDNGNDVAIGPNGEVYVGGSSQTTNGSTDFTLIKYDAAGNQVWVELYNGQSNKGNVIRRVRVDSQGNIIVAGSEQLANFYSDFITAKYDPNGNVLWLQRLDLTSAGDEIPWNMVIGADNAVYVTGESANQVATVKYDANGAQQWNAVFDSPTSLVDRGYGIALDAANGVVATGQDPILTIHYIQTGQVNQMPLAVASANPQSGTAPLTVNFSSAGSNDPDGTISAYSWNFGDGTGSTSPTPSHTYTNAGTHNATLTVTDNQGATDSDFVVITATSSCSNIALGKLAMASSSRGSNMPNLAVDGNTDTFWRSTSGGTQYLQVDLGADTHNYNEVTIRWRNIRYSKRFQIRVSNTANFSTFTTIFSTTTGSGGNQTISLSGPPRTERYIRLHMTRVNSGYYAVNELEVCGFSSGADTKQSIY